MGNKAGDETRTHNNQLGRLKTHLVSADGESTCEDHQANPRNNPRSSVDIELNAVVEAWPDLPGAVRAGIVAMVKAAEEA